MQEAFALPLPRRARVAAYHEPVRIGSDEALARRAARGDEAAFEELVVRHQDKLYTLALRVTLSEADAYDCVQEGLIAAWRALPRFRGDARFSTWMYRIVVRKAYDAIDRRRRTPEPVEDVQAVAPEGQPEARLDLIAALGALEPEFRVVAVACDILGMSMEQAGAMLELPAGTVKSRLHRARGQLAQALEPDRMG
jgi:RNA polymerase sigma-70 factor, ECF subfamily